MSWQINPILETVAQALWAPQDQTYLLTAVYRLKSIALIEPEILGVMKISLVDLESLDKIDAEGLSKDQLSQLAEITRPLKEEEFKPHPFFKLRNHCPSYTIALTTLPEPHSLFNDLEILIGKLLVKVIELNVVCSDVSKYEDFKRAASRASLLNENLADDMCQIGIKKLRKISLALRSFVETACNEASPEAETSKLFQRLTLLVNGFIKVPATPPRQVSAQPKAARQRKVEGSRKPHRDSANILNLRNPSLDVIYEFMPSAEPDEQFVVEQKVPPALVKVAAIHDYSPAELIDPLPIVSTRIHEYHSAYTAKARGNFQAKALANRSELLRWSTSNATPEQTNLILNRLSNEPIGSGNALGSFFILLSFVTGRLPESLIGSIAFGKPPRSSPRVDFLKQNINKPLVYFSTDDREIYLLVNKPPVKTLSEWSGAIKTKDYLCVFDYLSLGSRLIDILHQLRLSKGDLERLDQTELLNTVSTVNRQLKSIGYPPDKIWQILPRTLQNETGQNGAMALLTDWRTLNSHVELHYLCVDDQSLGARYQASLEAIIRYDGPDVRLKKRAGYYVGSPNAPSQEAAENLVNAFQMRLVTSNDLVECHNLMTLYTLALVTAGYGLRHAISPTIEVYRARDIPLLSYTEKGILRQIVIPKLVYDQLMAYERYRRVNISPFAEKVVPGKPTFFLLKPDLHVEQFHPESYEKYLERYGIEFKLALNSLRRWMFSQLFMEGQRGISTDFYGGHGVEGREPFSTFSSSTVDSLIDVANTMDKILRRTWRVLESR